MYWIEDRIYVQHMVYEKYEEINLYMIVMSI